MSVKVQYGLKLVAKDRLLGLDITHNGDERYACGEYTYKLDEWSNETPWLVDDEVTALLAKWSSEAWYNSDYDSPVNPYSPKDLQVVKVITMIVPRDSDIADEIKAVNEYIEGRLYGTKIDPKEWLEE